MTAELWNRRSVLEVLGDLTDKALEWQFADEKLGGFLVATDLTQSHCSRPVPMGFLHASGSGGALASGLGGQLLPRCLPPVDLRAVCLVRAMLTTLNTSVRMIKFALKIAIYSAQRA